MGAPIFFAPLRTPLVDARTGLMAREWYLFFQALWMRTGGATAPNSDDAFVMPAVEPDLTAFSNFAEAFGQLPQLQIPVLAEVIATELAELRALVAEQGKQIQDLRQGQVVL